MVTDVAPPPAPSLTISVVQVVTVRPTIAPGQLLGHMNASYRTLTYDAIPVESAVAS